MHECTCGRMKWLAICLPFIAAGNKQKFSFFFLLLCCGFWIWWARNIVRFVTFFVDAVMAEMPFSWCYVTICHTHLGSLGACNMDISNCRIVVECGRSTVCVVTVSSMLDAATNREPVAYTHTSTDHFIFLTILLHSFLRNAPSQNNEQWTCATKHTNHTHVCCVVCEDVACYCFGLEQVQRPWSRWFIFVCMMLTTFRRLASRPAYFFYWHCWCGNTPSARARADRPWRCNDAKKNAADAAI